MTTTSRSLLRFGIIAGPFYLGLGLIQAMVREGFDLTRHPLSVLANGPGGWAQTLNFVLTGAMVIAAAVGVKRTLAPKPGGVSGALMIYGLSMVAAALFPADPVDGFPVGTPEGMPTSISTRGMLHFVFGALAFTSLGVAGLLAARRFWQSARGLATLSLGAGLLVLGGFFGGFMIPGIGTLGIWASVVVGWAWLMALSLQLQRTDHR
jgi:hypothetical membrane protein